MRSVGVSQVIVAVSKIYKVDNSQQVKTPEKHAADGTSTSNVNVCEALPSEANINHLGKGEVHQNNSILVVLVNRIYVNLA